jgi:hypothetical protein
MVPAGGVFLWSGSSSCSDYSPTTTSAPSLKPSYPEWFPYMVPVSPGHHHPKVPHLMLTLLVVLLGSSSISEGTDPFIRSNSWFSATCWKSLLLTSWSPAWRSSRRSHWLSFHFQDRAAPRSLGSFISVISLGQVLLITLNYNSITIQHTFSSLLHIH